MKRRAISRIARFALGLLFVHSVASAHALEEGTARVTLRDEHLDVLVVWDLFLLVDRTPTAVATASNEELLQTHQRLVRRIETETRLSVDSAPAPLQLRGGPSPDELRALAAELSASGSEHGTRVQLRLEATHRARDARRIALSVPAALGPVVVTFVQPSTRYVLPGASASFPVLALSAPQVRAPEPSVSSSPSSAPPFAGWVLSALAFTLLLAASLRLRPLSRSTA